MINLPLVSINILSFNRKEELKNTLIKVYEQDYKNIEVIVVDNASEDGSAEMVEKEFPDVILIKMKKNIGIAGWNEGFKIAKGEFILVLDDDSYPDNNTILKGIDILEANNGNVILALKIYNNDCECFESNNLILNGDIKFFIGCGVIIPSKILKEVGYFSDILFLYEHEADYSMRALEKGFVVIYCEGCLINHLSSHLNRTSSRRKYFVTRNILINLTLHFNSSVVFFRILRIISGRLLSGIRQGDLFTLSKAVINYVLLLPYIIKNKKPLSKKVQKLFGYGNFAGGFHFKDNDWYN